MTIENKTVETTVFIKNGIAKTYVWIRLNSLYPCAPIIQTPKLVKIKNKAAPEIAPDILKIVDLLKNLEIKPIKRTLPHVNKIVEWNPINKSVNDKASTTTGIYLIPNTAGI